MPSKAIYKYKPELHAMTRLAIPIIIGQLGVVLMGVIDNIMIGRLLGKEALAAASLGNALAFLIGSIGFGGIPVLAPLFAKSRKRDKGKILIQYSFSIAIVSTLLILLSLFIIYKFEWLHQPTEIRGATTSFFWLTTLSNVPMFYFLLQKQVLDANENVKKPMIITFIGLLGNIIFNYIFIEGTSLWNAMGLNGAAYATIANRFLMLLLIIPFTWKYYKNASFKIKQHLSIVFKGVSFIAYAGVQVFFEVGAFAMAVVFMGWISKTALAAHQIAINIAAVAYMVATGVALASGIRIGNRLKENDFNGVRLASHVSFGIVALLMTLSFLIMTLLRYPLVNLYIENKEVIELGAQLLIIAALFQFSDGIQAVALGNLRGIADVKTPAFITFLAYWVFALPLGYVLGFKLNLEAKGVWVGLLVGLTIAAILLVRRFYRELEKTQREYVSI